MRIFVCSTSFVLQRLLKWCSAGQSDASDQHMQIEIDLVLWRFHPSHHHPLEHPLVQFRFICFRRILHQPIFNGLIIHGSWIISWEDINNRIPEWNNLDIQIVDWLGFCNGLPIIFTPIGSLKTFEWLMYLEILFIVHNSYLISRSKWRNVDYCPSTWHVVFPQDLWNDGNPGSPPWYQIGVKKKEMVESATKRNKLSFISLSKLS